MKFGDQTTLKIDSVDKKGRGCGLVNGRAACAYFTVPGEEIEAELIARKQGTLLFETRRVATPSPRRIPAPCPSAGSCGGCLWQQFDYSLQLELKRDLVNRAFQAAGLGERLDAVVPCPELFRYRNRMDYCVGPRGQVGLKKPGRWNAHLDTPECLLLSADAAEIMKRFREWLKKFEVKPWNGASYSGYARYLVIREGKNTGERLVTIVTSDGPLPGEEWLLENIGGLATTIYHGINATKTDLSITPNLRLLQGPPDLHEKIGGRIYAIPPNSFFQTNTLMAGEMLKTAKEFLAPQRCGRLLDLYCGVGFFGLGLADSADRVVGVEIDAPAIEAARRNAAANGVAAAEYFAAEAEGLIWKNEKPDTVIVDPPRSGLHPKVVATLLANLPERLLYVSCNYESFARDLKPLQAAYELKQIRALDLFPHSPHVELVSLLVRK
ncbi:MAG: 23S rRNA (uracil(1939)-C(5))-methyltransferase RlmD [Patescibacteria group bacterium]|jgi:23S rRNA (uracil-5-)-methyltransferase RumA